VSVAGQIEKIMEHARKRFAGWLDRYHPWHSDNHITERNLSFQFAQSFLSELKDGMVFLEAPVTNGGDRTDNHLDTYLHSQTLDIVLECKNFWAKRHVEAVKTDIERISTKFTQLLERHCPPGQGTQPVHGMVLAECWRRDHAEWWKGEKFKEWPAREAEFPNGWTFGYLTIHTHKEGADGTLYWLYGYSVEPLNSAALTVAHCKTEP